jgi:hypothetical protein
MSRHRHPNLAPIEVASISQRYQAGESARAIARSLNLHPSTVLKQLHRHGVVIRPFSVSNRHDHLDESVFDRITEESAYWIGLLMADGSISLGPYSHTISISLAGADGHHLERLRTFLKSSNALLPLVPRKPWHQAPVRLSVSSHRLVAALAKYGVLPRKTYTAQVIGLEGNRNFWRGMIDGDGEVTIKPINTRPYATIGLAGNLAICEQFAAFARTHAPSAALRVQPTGTSYGVRLTGNPAITLVKTLYRRCTVALPRKWQTAQEIMRLPPYVPHVFTPGGMNPRRRFTPKAIRLIRAIHTTGLFSQVQIAKMFDTDQPHISAIVLRHIWKHL